MLNQYFRVAAEPQPLSRRNETPHDASPKSCGYR
jgi:hypothetical protein